MRHISSFLGLICLLLLAQESIGQLLTPVSLRADKPTKLSANTKSRVRNANRAPGHNDVKHGRVDTHAPAFLMGDHVHEPGEWMVEYKFSNMYMHGNRASATQLSNQEALNFIGTVPPGTPGVNAYMATPTRMTMEMHMVHIMRGITNDITAYIMPMWMVNTMDHLRRDETTFTTSNSGLSDLHFGALWRIYNGCPDELILNLRFSAPTGDIDDKTDIPTGSPTEFPYPMRLGHGTWNTLPAVTYRYYGERASLGLQGSFLLPMGTNDSNYQVGNEYRTNVWFSYLLDCDKKLAATFRVEGLWRDNFDGADPQLNPNMISTADPNMRGGEFLNLGYGLMYMLPRGGRLNFEVTNPVVQNLRGVQLETDWALAASYSKAF